MTTSWCFQAPRDRLPQIGKWHRIVVMVPGDLNMAMQFAKTLPGYDPAVTYQSIPLGSQQGDYGPACMCYMEVREAPKAPAAQESSEFSGNQFTGSEF